jgi:hypothetical protein
MPEPGYRSYEAWIDLMPRANETLHVKGEVTVPTTGYKAKLVEAEPQGINPAILLLRLELTKAPGRAGDVVTTLDVRYSRLHAKQYKEVQIEEEGHPSKTVPVKEVHVKEVH